MNQSLMAGSSLKDKDNDIFKYMEEHDIQPGPWGIGKTPDGRGNIRFTNIEELDLTGDTPAVRFSSGEKLSVPPTTEVLDVNGVKKITKNKEGNVSFNLDNKKSSAEEITQVTNLDVVSK